MLSASDDIKDMLEADSSLGLEFANNLFVGKEPTNPDNCVTIFDTPGYPPILTLDGNGGLYYPSIQIRVRNRSLQLGMALAQSLMELLHGRHQETWNGTIYCAIACAGEPALLDWDTNNRCRIIVDFNIQRRQ